MVLREPMHVHVDGPRVTLCAGSPRTLAAGESGVSARAGALAFTSTQFVPSKPKTCVAGVPSRCPVAQCFGCGAEGRSPFEFILGVDDAQTRR